jgi:hypothetical protein
VINVTELNKERAMSNQAIDWLESQQDNMLDLLGELVNIDSNSFDKAGVDRVAKRLAEFLMPSPFRTKPYPSPPMVMPCAQLLLAATVIGRSCYAAIAILFSQRVKLQNVHSELKMAGPTVRALPI